MTVDELSAELACDPAVKRFVVRLRYEVARPGDSLTVRSGNKSFKFRLRKGGGMRVSVSRLAPPPVRPEVEEFARGRQGQPPVDVPGVDEFEQQVTDALRRGAHAYHVTSGTKTFTVTRKNQFYVKPYKWARQPEVEAVAEYLRKVRYCARPDCRKPFVRQGRQCYGGLARLAANRFGGASDKRTTSPDTTYRRLVRRATTKRS